MSVIALKIIFLGDGGVGKTSIKNRYLGKGFNSSYLMTLGADFSVKRYENKAVQIWDLAGQESFRKVRKNYYLGSSGSFLVFDVCNRESFQNLEKWVEEIEVHNEQMVPTLILANKVDLVEENTDHVTDAEISELQAKLNEKYNFEFPAMKTSALTGFHIDEAFNRLFSEIDKNPEKYVNY